MHLHQQSVASVLLFTILWIGKREEDKNKMSQALPVSLVMNEIPHALRAILDENEKARDSAFA